MKHTKILFAMVTAICIAIGAATIANAGDKQKTIGEVTMVDTARQVMQITDQNGRVTEFLITPKTDMEFEKNGMLSWDHDATISDLRPGQWVKVKYKVDSGANIAKDVNIYKLQDR